MFVLKMNRSNKSNLNGSSARNTNTGARQQTRQQTAIVSGKALRRRRARQRRKLRLREANNILLDYEAKEPYTNFPVGNLRDLESTRFSDIVNPRSKLLVEYPMKDIMTKYLCLVGDPFGCGIIARPPDSRRDYTMVMQDFYRQTVVSVDAYNLGAQGTANHNAYGLFIMWVWGYNILNSNSVYPFSWDGTVIAGVVNSGGYLCTTDGVSTINYFDGVNSTELGNLSTAIRPIAAGLQVWPTIEEVTNSSTVAIQDIWTGFMQPKVLFESFWEGGNPIDSYIANLMNTQHYSNRQGASARYNPFQQPLLELLTYQQANTIAYDRGQCYFPYIYIRLNNPLPGNTSSTVDTFVFPIEINARWYVEATLGFPTPLFPTPSPVDPDFEKIAAAINGAPNELFPYFTEGHSFSSFLKKIPNFLNYLGKFLRFGSDAVAALGTASDSIYASAIYSGI